jgi:hypothetical protein
MKSEPHKKEIEGFEPTQEGMEMLLSEYREIIDALKDFNDKYEINGFLLDGVDEYGGEGQGEDYWVVIEVTKGNHKSFWQFDGWYASYDGGHLENVWEVTPTEKVVTVYEQK